MSYEVTNGAESLGQFASNRGYSDLIIAAESYTALVKFFDTGETGEVDACIEELRKLSEAGNGVGETAVTLADLMEGQEHVIISDGVVEDEEVEKQHSGVMIAYMLPPDQQKALAVEGGEEPEEIHLTLLYLGQDLTEEQVETVKDIVNDAADNLAPLQGTVGGKGRFPATDSTEGRDVIIRMVDAPRLEALRETLISALRAEGIEPVLNHGYTPHITIAYVEPDFEGACVHPEEMSLTIDALTVAVGGEQEHYPMVGEEVVKTGPTTAEVHVNRPLGDEDESDEEEESETDDEALEKILRHEDGKWVLYSHDGSKKLGTFDTEEQAKERERQINYFKHVKKLQSQAPHYREALGDQKCSNCAHGGDGYCDLYHF